MTGATPDPPRTIVSPDAKSPEGGGRQVRGKEDGSQEGQQSRGPFTEAEILVGA